MALPETLQTAAGDRTAITWPDTVAISYDYDVLQRARHIYLGSYTVAVFSGARPRAGRRTDPGNAYGRRSGITRANSGGAPTSYAGACPRAGRRPDPGDGADRISTLTQSLTGTGAVTYTLGYDPAGGLVSDQVSNGAYLFHGPPTGSAVPYVADGLNRYTTVNSIPFSYDNRKNLDKLSSSGPTFSYDTENNLLSTDTPPGLTLIYDALGRIQTSTSRGVATTFLFSGSMLVGEYDSSGNVLARYVPGPGTDEAIVWYAGAGTTTPQWLHADALGSTIAWSNATGGSLGTQAYDPFGQPAAWSGSRYAYTGQLMLGEAQLYDYKARAYSPSLGRFMQTDPAGYASDVNPYAYVGNDPIGLTDPSGMVNCFVCTRTVLFDSEGGESTGSTVVGELTIFGHRYKFPDPVILNLFNNFINGLSSFSDLASKFHVKFLPPCVSPGSKGSVKEPSPNGPVSLPNIQPGTPIFFRYLGGAVAEGPGFSGAIGQYWLLGADHYVYSGLFATGGMAVGEGAMGSFEVGGSLGVGYGNALGAFFQNSASVSGGLGVVGTLGGNQSGVNVSAGVGIGAQVMAQSTATVPLGAPHIIIGLCI